MRLHLATPGDTYLIVRKKDLKEILATGNFALIKTVYIPKKWWQFWKKKKIAYYEVMCIKNLKGDINEKEF